MESEVSDPHIANVKPEMVQQTKATKGGTEGAK